MVQQREADRDHRLKECTEWEEEIHELWVKVGKTSGERKQEGGQFKGRKGFCYDVRKAKVGLSNVSMGNELFTETVLGSLKNTRVGGHSQQRMNMIYGFFILPVSLAVLSLLLSFLLSFLLSSLLSFFLSPLFLSSHYTVSTGSGGRDLVSVTGLWAIGGFGYCQAYTWHVKYNNGFQTKTQTYNTNFRLYSGVHRRRPHRNDSHATQ